MNSAEAQALFHDFNHRYFAGTLPRYRVRVVDHITKIGEAGRITRKSRRIRISAGLDEARTIATLVHEMAHAATNDRHARRFIEEMNRLLHVGAPITYENDLELYVETVLPKRLTRTFLRSTAADAVIDNPTMTLPSFVRWFICDYGYADSSAEFLRRYPWVSRIFRDVKKSARAEEKRRARFTLPAALTSTSKQE